ncbi:MAG: DMT family transporter [Firmicutes bacterium]|nr:DMT family transporter [Bacillota bacterium]
MSVGAVLGLVSGACFGLAAVLARRAVREAGVVNTMFWNMLINAALYALMTVAAASRGGVTVPPPHATAVFAAGGLASLVLGRSLQYVSVDLIGAPRAAAFRVAAPVPAVVFGVVFLDEVLTPGRALAIATILAGLVLVNRQPPDRRPTSDPPPDRATDETAAARASSPAASAPALGILAGAGSSLFFAVGDAVRKHGMNVHPDPIMASLVGALVGLLLYTIIGAWDRRKNGSGWPGLPRRARMPVIGGAVATCAALLAFNWSLVTVPVTVATPLAATQALFAIAFTRLLEPRAERVTAGLLLGSLVVLAGLVWLLAD